MVHAATFTVSHAHRNRVNISTEDGDKSGDDDEDSDKFDTEESAAAAAADDDNAAAAADDFDETRSPGYGRYDDA